jgi:multicomponent Na+:H+ antiporter subunit C
MNDIGWLLSKYNYYGYIILLMIGLYALIAKKNLIKKVIGLNIIQTAIILFFITIGAKKGATIPILWNSLEHNLHQTAQYINALPHVLMLTAIVVGVGTTGVALSLIMLIYRQYGSIEDDEILKRVEAADDNPPIQGGS